MIERVAIFVDGDYLYRAFPRVDVGALKNILTAGRSFALGLWFLAYTDHDDLTKKQNFFRVLQSFGFEVHPIPLKVNSNGKKKSRVDAFLMAELSRRLLAEELGLQPCTDTFILVSGDSDYEPILRLVKERGRRVEVAYKQGLSAELSGLADHIFDLNAYQDQLARELPAPKPAAQETEVDWVGLKLVLGGKVLEIPLYQKGAQRVNDHGVEEGKFK